MRNITVSPRLLGDVGGTHARFAWQAAANQPLQDIQTLRCADHDSLASALGSYIAQVAMPAPQEAALGIASPITGDTVRMTNHPWSFSIQALKQALSLQRLVVINDFTALALSLPDLPPEQLHAIGGGRAVASAPVALIGPGTGLGVSGLVPDGQGGWLPLAGEGGHVSLAAQTDLEALVIQQLARRNEGHVSAERVLSGPGLVALHQALAALRGMTADPDITPAHITQAALQAHDPLSLQTLETFSAFLGTVAGDLALTLGARGGVYLGGGILPHWRDWLAQSPFRARFEAKGRYRDYMAAIPVWWIDAPTSPALMGAARALKLKAI